MNIFVAGHRGMVGSAIVRALDSDSAVNIITACRSSLDLLNQEAVFRFFNDKKIDQVYLAAAKVGGIYANNEYPAQFIYENLTITSNVVHAAHLAGVQKLLFLGSSCIYPRLAAQPIREEYLLTGPLEHTNEPYAIAKIAGIKMCESYNRQYSRDYRSIMPTNLYGPNDNFHPDNSHVIPALIRRFHSAVTNNVTEVKIWGTGTPMREFLHVDDMASASVYLMNVNRDRYHKFTDTNLSHVNVGSGTEISIRQLAEMICEITKFRGKLTFDPSKPDGTPRKLLNNERAFNLGWSPSVCIGDGLRDTYDWYKSQLHQVRSN